MNAFKKTSIALSGLLILEPRVFGDERGFFLESYNDRALAEWGLQERFVQDNHSFSRGNVLRIKAPSQLSLTNPELLP